MIRVGRLLDGFGGRFQERMSVLIENSRICAIGPSHQLGLPDGCEGPIFEFPDATMLPGLIDCHTHTNMPGDGRRGEDVNEEDTDDDRLLRSARNVRLALLSGVTTLSDCGAWNTTAFSVKRGVETGIVDGSRVLAAGRPITITKGHCWFMGGEADGVRGVAEQAKRLVDQGADFLKIMATGGSTVGSDPYTPSFSREELKTIVDIGHKENLAVVAHCRSNVAIRMAVDVGIDTIMHGWFTGPDGVRGFDEELAHHIASHGVRINPTIYITGSRIPSLQLLKESGEATPDEEERLERMLYNHAATVADIPKLLSAGVDLMAGSDCGWGTYPFGMFYLELEAMVKGGLSPDLAVVSATTGNAKMLKIIDDLGSISSGKQADLLIVHGAPDENIQNIRNVEAVFKAGRRVL